MISVKHSTCRLCPLRVWSRVGGWKGKGALKIAGRGCVRCLHLGSLVGPFSEDGTRIFAWRGHRSSRRLSEEPSAECIQATRPSAATGRGVEDGGGGRQSKARRPSAYDCLTRFETPPSKRDASTRVHVIDASRNTHALSRASTPAVLVRPCDSHSPFCLRRRTVSDLLPHAYIESRRRADNSGLDGLPT